MNIAEAFYQLRQLTSTSCGIPIGEATDTIHAAMESLKSANVALEAEVVRLKSRFDEAQAACAQWHNLAKEIATSSRAQDGSYISTDDAILAIEQLERLGTADCGTALLAEVKELRKEARSG